MYMKAYQHVVRHTGGYTHAFESTFESLAGLQEYLDSPALAAFAKDFLPTLSQRLVMDYFLY
uniref:Stress-response A/B barrel domain-containing protein n=1 Tax=Salix viminalis TaxID=40686 RepID=A0A6N2M7Y6_SALVM